MRKLAKLPIITLINAAIICSAQSYQFETISAPTPNNQYYGTAISTYVYGINNNQVVGVYLDNIDYRGFILNGSTYTYFDAPGAHNRSTPGDAISTYGFGISGNNIVGYFSDSIGSGGTHGYLFNGTTFTELYRSDIYTYDLSANAISGNRVAGSYTQGSYVRSFLYDIQSQTYLTLPTFFQGGQTIIGSRAYGVSDNNVVGIFSGYDQIIGYKVYGYLYDINSQNYAVIDFPGSYGTHAYGISQSKVVGSFWGQDYVMHGFVYDITLGTYNQIDAPNSQLTYIRATENDKIAGYFQDASGNYQGFIATELPQPITGTINQHDTRIVGGSNLVFQGGRFIPTAATSFNNNIVINTTGEFDATHGDIDLDSNIAIASNGVLTLSGTTDSHIYLQGSISGAGSIINSGGNNSLSGTNNSGGTTVTGGVLYVASSASLSGANNFVANGSLILGNTNGASSFYGQEISVFGDGVQDRGAIVLGDSNHSGSIVISGQINLTGDARIGLEGINGFSAVIDGGITATNSNTKLTLRTGTGTEAVINSQISQNISEISKIGPGKATITDSARFLGVIYIKDGLLEVTSPLATGQTTVAAQGGVIKLCDSGLTSLPYNYRNNFSLESDIQSSLIIGSTGSASNIELSGQIIASGNPTITINSGISALRISGNISSSSPSSNVIFQVPQGAELELSGSISPSISSISKIGQGLMTIRLSCGAALNCTGGTVLIASPGAISPQTSTFSDTSLIIETGAGAGKTISSSLDITGNGPSGAAITFGSLNNNGTLTSTGTISLHTDATIRTEQNSQSSIVIQGAINSQNKTLNFDVNTLSSVSAEGLVNAGIISKTSAGLLTLSGQANGTTIVSAGTLKVNGVLNGDVSIGLGSSLKGSGTISGNVTNNGTIAPGNSPGVLTIAGAYISTSGSFYDAEIAGSNGAGAPSGHDMISVTGTPGTFTIQNNSGLRIIKLGGFEPARGDSFRLVNAQGGIIGSFSTINSQFSHWVLFDVSSGKLYGTGLLPNQNLSQILPSFGSAIWQNAILIKSNDALNGYAGTFDSTTIWGQAALAILSGDNLPGSLDASPYLAESSVLISSIRDENTSLLSLFQNRRFERASSPQNAWAGFIQYNSLSGKSQVSANYTSSGATAGLVCDISRTASVALSASSHTSSTTFLSHGGSGRGQGFSFSAACSALIGTKDAFFLDAGINAGRESQKTYRSTFLGTQTASGEMSNFAAFTRFGTGILINKSLSVTPYAGLDHVHTSGFSLTESGDLTSLTASVKPRNSSRAQLGTAIDWCSNLGTSLTKLSLAIELFNEFGNGPNEVTYHYSGTAPTTTTEPTGRKTGLRFTPRIEYSPDKVNLFYLIYSHEDIDGAHSSSFNLGYKRSF